MITPDITSSYYIVIGGPYRNELPSLKKALEIFNKVCEEYPKTKFKIIRRTTTDEVVKESDDYRQTRFDFVQ